MKRLLQVVRRWLTGRKKNLPILITVLGVALLFAVFSDVAPLPPAADGAVVQGATREGTGPYKDGSYTGKGAAYNGDLVMQVEVKQGWISGLAIQTTQDDAEYLNQAKTLLAKVLEQQSTSLDAVSGATFSSYGILDAVDDALKNAGRA